MKKRSIDQLDFERRNFKSWGDDIQYFIRDMLEDPQSEIDPALIQEMKTKSTELCQLIKKAEKSLVDSINEELNSIKYKVGDYLRLPSTGDGISQSNTVIYYIRNITDKGLIIYDVLKVTKGEYLNSISYDEKCHTTLEIEGENIEVNKPEDIAFFKKYSSLIKEGLF